MLNRSEVSEIKAFIKRVLEGSSSGAVGGFLTPKAFNPDPDAEGSESAVNADDTYSIKPDKDKKHFIELKEANYQQFKMDDGATQTQKVNKRILEINRALRELSRALDHGIRLKKESSMEDSALWVRANEAIIKIHKKLSEVAEKAGQLADVKQVAVTLIQRKLAQLFNKAGFDVHQEDVECVAKGSDTYECDILVHGEPISIDYAQGELSLQDYDKAVPIGNINDTKQLPQMAAKLKQLIGA